MTSLGDGLDIEANARAALVQINKQAKIRIQNLNADGSINGPEIVFDEAAAKTLMGPLYDMVVGNDGEARQIMRELAARRSEPDQVQVNLIDSGGNPLEPGEYRAMFARYSDVTGKFQSIVAAIVGPSAEHKTALEWAGAAVLDAGERGMPTRLEFLGYMHPKTGAWLPNPPTP